MVCPTLARLLLLLLALVLLIADGLLHSSVAIVLVLRSAAELGRATRARVRSALIRLEFHLLLHLVLLMVVMLLLVLVVAVL